MVNYVEDHYHYGHHHHHDMSEDVLIEIFIRLPVKSLLRFKCICKYWYALILNPTFVNHRLNFKKGDNQGRLLLQHYISHSYQYGYALFPDKILANTSYHNLDYLHGETFPVYIDGPINGLFCLNFQDRFIIWNPATKEFRSLPFPYHPKIPLDFNLDWYSFGFGFDPITKDYKVVLRQQFANEITMDFPEKDVIVDVYTQSTNTWRHLDGLDYVSSEYLTSHHGNGEYLDGIYYWPDVRRVLAFDVGNEVFRAILGPDTPVHYSLLTLYNDHIALCGFKTVPESEIDIWIEFWVMELEASWIKQFCIEAPPRIERLLGFWNNSEFLFVVSNSLQKHCYDNSQVVLYDFTTQEFRDIGPKGTYYIFQARTYYESLVSIKGGLHHRTGKLSDSDAAYYFFKYRCRFVFMYDFVDFMSEFQIGTQWNTELMYTDIDHIKVRGMLTKVWESCEYSVDAFMDDFVNFMSDFQICKQWNTEPIYTDIDHIKMREMLTRMWESNGYSVDLSN